MGLEICLPESWKEWSIVGEEPIGRGSYGAVYKAQREVGDRRVFSAVKVIDIPHDDEELQSLRLEYNDEESVKEYFLDIKDSYVREIELMAEFRGISNIVSIEDFLVESKEDIGWRIYIRMEYLEDLRLWIRENELTEEEVIKIASDICNALVYCEKENIIHRDIKPANILRSPMGDYKLGDFGVAMISKPGSGSYSSKGTFEYMAPEVYKGEHYGMSADIYSLGIVLYWLTNRTHEKNRNRFPFESTYKEMLTYKEKENALNRRMNGEMLAEPADASPELSRIILKACAYHPQDRYQNASEMLKDLNALRAQKAQAPGAVAEEETASTGGHKFILIIATVIIAAILLGAGLGIGRHLSGNNGNNQQEPEEAWITEKMEAEEETGEEETEKGETEKDLPLMPETEAVTEEMTETKIATEKITQMADTESAVQELAGMAATGTDEQETTKMTEAQTVTEEMAETETVCEETTQMTETFTDTEEIMETETVTEKITQMADTEPTVQELTGMAATGTGEQETLEMTETEAATQEMTETETAAQKMTETTETETATPEMTQITETEKVTEEMTETKMETESEKPDQGENEQVYQKYQEIIDEAIDGFSQDDPLYTVDLYVGQTETPGLANAWTDVICYSSDESVVTVSEEGKVTAVGPGTAYVFLMSEEAFESASAIGISPTSQVFQYHVSGGATEAGSTRSTGSDDQLELEELSKQFDEWNSAD